MHYKSIFINWNHKIYIHDFYHMKKLLIVISIIWISLVFVWCNRHNNSDNSQYNICTDNEWNPESRFNWSGKLDVCYFNDESFCFLDDLKNWECKKWDYYYEDEEYYKEAFEKLNQDINNEENDNEENVENISQEIAECDEKWEDIVCWKDGNTYFNKCYLEFAWVEEETELAEIIDWKCVFW